MNNEIFESIIEITRQKDTDSLEYSLSATIAELMDIHEVMLINVPFKDLRGYLTSELCLKVTVVQGKKIYKWHNKVIKIELNTDIQTVIAHHQPHGIQVDDTQIFYFPVVIDDTLHSILQIKSSDDVLKNRAVINGFIRIYQNYQVILTENERDKLTGLLNRKTFENKLNKLLKQKGSSNQSSSHLPCWLVMIDIDHFKAVNDNFGHISGDEILLLLSQMMQDYFMGSNLLFRFGGEEFVIILDAMPLAVAKATLEHFRNLISEYEFPFVGSLTISMGFSKFTLDDFPPAILDQADKALYYAKKHGRNCVYNYETLIEEGKLTAQSDNSSIELF